MKEKSDMDGKSNEACFNEGGGGRLYSAAAL